MVYKRRLGKLGLGALTLVDQLVAKADIGIVIPADNVAQEPFPREIFNLVVILVGNAETVRLAAILVVHNLGMRTIHGGIVDRLVVLVVARRSHPLHLVVLDKDDNGLPVVSVSGTPAAADDLVFFKVIVVPICRYVSPDLGYVVWLVLT